jgi:hypothetical protein
MHIKLADQSKAPARHKPLRLTMLALSLACAGLQAHADPATDRINQLERKLEQSMQKINDLTNRLLQLEGKQAANKPAPAAVAQATSAASPAEQEASAKRIDALEQQVSAMANRSTADDGLAMHGFASVGSVFTNKQGAKSGATIESLDFYLAPQFGGHIRSLFELNAEAGEAGDVAVDLERLQLGYAFGDELTLWAGRFHTPYGYWNTAFHHGAQIQTSVMRPRFLDFEDSGGILPAHSVGLWAHGGTKHGDTRIDYDAWLSNAPTIRIDGDTGHVGTLNPNLHGTTGNNPIVGAKVGITPEALGGLTLGVHGYHARVGGPGTGDGAFQSRTISDSTMLGGYWTYQENDWEVLGEYYHFKDKNLRPEAAGFGLSFNSWAGYAQAGRTYGLWTPYVRFEKTNLNQLDEYFAAQESGRSYRRAVAGVRYDLGSRSALKVEFNRTHQADAADPTDTSVPAPGSFNETRLQFAVRF